jgi:hypothetical protein
VSFRDRPDVQLPDQTTLAEVHVLVVTKVLLDGESEPTRWRDQQQAMEVRAAIAKDERRGMRDPACRPAGRQSR